MHSELSMQNHISKVTQTCFYHIRRLKQVRKLLGPDVAAKLVASLAFSRLDYCNAILANLPRSTIALLQRVQNAAARLVARLGPYDHVTANSVQVTCADAPNSHRPSAILSLSRGVWKAASQNFVMFVVCVEFFLS